MFKYIGQASQERGVAPYSFQPKWGVEAGEEDRVRLLAHRAPEEEYKSIHPPLEEREEPEYVVREMVEPITPRQRAGIEPGILAGRTIARTGLRGRTVHGQRGMIFDVLKTEKVKTEEPTYEKFEEVISEKVPSEIMKEIRERITIYGRSEEVTKSLEKLDIEGFRRGEEEFRHLGNIRKHTAKFESKRGVQPTPEKMLSLLESKRYAIENKKEEDWWVELEEIKEVEKEYYKDVPPYPKWLEDLLRSEKTLTVEEARNLVKKDIKFAEEHNLNIKSFLRELQMQMHL